MSSQTKYKVVLVFSLKEGEADEELRRSKEEHSFPNMLATQPGFLELELVKISDSKTMSIQTWETEKHWFTALETVKVLQSQLPQINQRVSILLERDFLAGTIMVHKKSKN